jgi:dihydroorotase-like cyclic amidohydrolase
LNLNKGTLSIGADADVTVFDADDANGFSTPATSASKSKNSPFFGWKLKGQGGGDRSSAGKKGVG